MKISFEEFKNIMTDIVNFEEFSDRVKGTFRDYNNKTRDMASIEFPDTTCDTILALSLLLNDKSEWISYWVYELDCGQKYEVGMVTDENGKEIKLKTIEDLWKVLNTEEPYMNFEEVRMDLFTVPQGYYLAHCISGDYALGAGIAKSFNNIYNMRFKLRREFPIPEGKKFANVGKALLVDNVFNLVTKQRYFHKPTYDSLYDTLVDMREQCEKRNIKKVAMPRIGTGLDRLEWEKVQDIIMGVFEDTDIQILICKL